ncbi:hypothetical protein CHELA40_13355 [Chelatococcus asaccharovorans]|nr:hypothetical protein CHELA40_13355 [Chelatococcus asaccharovorans]CAH1678593.1 hypothetical protein CHELA17_62264 [Chelatococcus asaccharovorans]
MPASATVDHENADDWGFSLSQLKFPSSHRRKDLLMIKGADHGADMRPLQRTCVAGVL